MVNESAIWVQKLYASFHMTAHASRPDNNLYRAAEDDIIANLSHGKAEPRQSLEQTTSARSENEVFTIPSSDQCLVNIKNDGNEKVIGTRGEASWIQDAPRARHICINIDTAEGLERVSYTFESLHQSIGLCDVRGNGAEMVWK